MSIGHISYEEFKELMEKIERGEDTKEDYSSNLSFGDIKYEPHGIKSVISKEEIDALVKIGEGLKEFLTLHNKSLCMNLEKLKVPFVQDISLEDSFTGIQFLVYHRAINELVGNVGALININRVDRNFIQALVSEQGSSVVDFYKNIFMEVFLKSCDCNM